MLKSERMAPTNKSSEFDDLVLHPKNIKSIVMLYQNDKILYVKTTII
jgi:hypothetical protein